jgi:tetratricopeptide (TPR) repeat protein
MVDAHLNRASVSLDMGALSDAETAATSAIRLDPRNPRGYALKGMAVTRLDRLADALPVIQQALRLAPESAEAHLALAQHYFAQKKEQEAESVYRKVIALNPAKSRHISGWGGWPWPMAVARTPAVFKPRCGRPDEPSRPGELGSAPGLSGKVEER